MPLSDVTVLQNQSGIKLDTYWERTWNFTYLSRYMLDAEMQGIALGHQEANLDN